jgi:hypothetical protein
MRADVTWRTLELPKPISFAGGVMDQRVPTETVNPLDMVACPECGTTASVEWRDVAGSTGGPVEHVKIHCLEGHRFLMLAERLSPVAEATAEARPERPAPVPVG